MDAVDHLMAAATKARASRAYRKGKMPAEAERTYGEAIEHTARALEILEADYGPIVFETLNRHGPTPRSEATTTQPQGGNPPDPLS